jgi:hypothetical protein
VIVWSTACCVLLVDELARMRTVTGCSWTQHAFCKQVLALHAVVAVQVAEDDSSVSSAALLHRDGDSYTSTAGTSSTSSE